MGLTAVAVLATQTIAYYYLQNSLNPEPSKSVVSCQGTNESCISVDTLINYGNTTIAWFNVSDVPASWNFYQLTARLVNVTSAYYGQPLNEHLVTGINGVQESGSSSWRLWVFCESRTAWVFSQVGADLVSLSNRSILAWAFESDPNQPPVTGAATVGFCA